MQNSFLISFFFFQTNLKKEIGTPSGIAYEKIQIAFMQTLKQKNENRMFNKLITGTQQ
jgi:hypothetical protein